MIYDVIVIGKGPAGISTSLYARRSNLNVLVIGLDNSALLKAKCIDNYYGNAHVDGKTLFELGINQAIDLGVEVKTEEILTIALDIIDSETNFKVETSKDTYLAKSVIIASGTKRSIPNIANLKQFEDKNLSYCAVCDGFFYRGRKAFVLGDGTYALSEAEELAKNASEVTIFTNGAHIVSNNAKLKIEERKIKTFEGNEKLTHVVLENDEKIEVPSLFIAWKTAGGYDFARKLGAEVKNGQIVVNAKMETNIPGLYACGDVVGDPYQVAKAVYEGFVAGGCVSDFLKNKKNN